MRPVLVWVVVAAFGCGQDAPAPPEQPEPPEEPAEGESEGEPPEQPWEPPPCTDDVAGLGSIQAAIDAAADGEVIEVCPGLYEEDLVIDGKSVAVRGRDGAAVTVVEGSGAGPVWTVRGVGGAGAAIEGMTIRGGDGGEAGGGGVRCEAARLAVRDAVVEANAGEFGGGVLAAACEITIEDTELRDNTAATFGGGALLYESDGEVRRTLFQGNQAAQGGGLASWASAVVVAESAVRENRATSPDQYTGGGGAWIDGDGVSITASAIVANESAADGGGLFVAGGAPEIRESWLAENRSAGDGGGVYGFVSSATVVASVFAGNVADDDGGGLRMMTGSGVIQDNLFVGNVAWDDGGGVKVSHAENLFERNHLWGNVAGDAGGGLELDNDTTAVLDSTFVGNAAATGGGLHSSSAEDALAIYGATFENNAADACGGAIAVESNPFEFSVVHVVARGNQAARGGGLCAVDATVGVANTIFAGNAAAESGGAFALERAGGFIANVVVDANEAPDGAGLAVVDGGSLAVLGAIVSASAGGAAVSLTGSGFLLWAYGDVFGGGFSGMDDPTGTLGNLAADPLFVAPAAGDYHLGAGSPCIDAGAPDITDADGSPADIGAYGGPLGVW